MLPWLRRRKTAERIDAEADALIDELGVEAYAKARRREYELSNDAIALRWNQVALAVAYKTGKRIGFDTSTRLAMNTIFAPDREHPGDRQPQPFSQADELKGTLALQPFQLQFISSATDRGPSIVTKVEIQASDASGAIVAAAKVTLPPRTIGLRILDTEAARSLVDGRAIARGSTNDRDTIRGIVPATWTPPERRFDRRLMKSNPKPKACVCHASASSRVRCVRVNRPRTVGPPRFQCGARRMQGNNPGLVADNPILARRRPRSERPERRVFVCDPKLPPTLRRRVPLPRRTCANPLG